MSTDWDSPSLPIAFFDHDQRRAVGKKKARNDHVYVESDGDEHHRSGGGVSSQTDAAQMTHEKNNFTSALLS